MPKKARSDPPKKEKDDISVPVVTIPPKELEGMPKYISKCVYFPSRLKLLELEAALAPYPRATVSTLVAQLVDPLKKALMAAGKNQRKIEVKCTLWL
jgi:hypothetical protein